MAGIIDLPRILHHIKVKLYPNYLPNAGKGKYIARTDSDKTVDIKDICTIMVTRAGFEGHFETLYDYTTRFFDEMMYQLCDGFTVNLGYFTIHVNIGGTFASEKVTHNHKDNPLGFSFSVRPKMRDQGQKVDVQVDGVADMPAYIDEFTDLEQNSINGFYTPGNGFSIHGHKIKVEGDDQACGVYLVPVQDPSKKVKVQRILENNPSKVMGLAPSTGFQENRIEIVTQYTGGDGVLKAPRTIASRFLVEEA